MKTLVVKSSARYMRNPNGYTQSRAGDETLAWPDIGRDADTVYFTREEIRLLEELAGRKRTDLLDDLAGSDNQSERLFIVTELVRRTGELALAVGGSWGGGGKWLARRLDTTAPELSARLHHGLQEVLGGRVETLVALVDEVLGQTGGRLWFGHKRVGAP